MNAICFLLDNGNFRRFRMINLPEGILKSKIMEVKIKNGEEMIDATIEMVDGVMVVSPKVEKFEPKDGDVVSSPNGREFFIFKGNQKGIYGECYCGYSLIKDCLFKAGIWHIVRFATEAEKKMLFDKLKEEGYEWDAEKKKVVRLKWKPKAGQSYYIPIICNAKFKSIIEDWSDDSMDALYFDKGWCFKTKEECQVFCEKLNQAIEGIKS